jgi:virulence-associated protein VagC
MSIGTVFVHNGTQAVSLPMDVRLPEGVPPSTSRSGKGFDVARVID